MRHLQACPSKGIALYRVAVVLACNLDFARFQIFDRMVSSD